MSKHQAPFVRAPDAAHVAWTVLSPVFTALLIIQLFQWAQGRSHWSTVLMPAALSLIGAVYLWRLRGAARKVAFGVSGVLAALAVVMAFIR